MEDRIIPRNVGVTDSQWQLAKESAFQTRIPLREWIRRAIAEKLERESAKA